ncbi:hypothetical protein SAMN04488113_12341 [Alkalibacterium gilvum]|uniref:Uncharacterized protein n=1 Tax=Alkalibacterium gilvum TaxID=1130080 RepID=A0A1H6TUF5_9LACT|nr:hypothetical protein [Alkalibacterium gilvum]SEI82876.1 hypothetical protein SAMN04488113_12341 [Alkalibacterium gilvum]
MDPLESIARLVVLIFQTFVFLVMLFFVGGPILFIGYLFGTVGLVIAVFIVFVISIAFIGNQGMKSEEKNL